jgi:hypothetical protein
MFMKMGTKHWWNDTDRGEQKFFGENPVTMSHFLKQILRGLTWDQTFTFMTRGQ